MNDRQSSDISQMNILVTGGAGFIGCAIARRLAPLAHRYIVLDNLHPQVHVTRSRPQALHGRAELIIGDVTDSSAWDETLGRIRPDIVIHLAAETGTGQSLTEATRHGAVNVVGTTQLIDALGRHEIRVRHIVLTSSRAIYGEGAWRAADGKVVYPGQRSRAQLETGLWDFPGLHTLAASAGKTWPMPTSVYGATKLAQEHVLQAWTQATGVQLSVLRLQNVYGPGQSLTNSYTGIVVLFSRLAKAGGSIPLYEDGQMTRDFVFIDDVADAITRAVVLPPTTMRVCDVGSGQSSTIQQLAESIAEFYHAPKPHVCGKFRDGDVRHGGCDITATLNELSWRPQSSLTGGMAALHEWIADQL